MARPVEPGEGRVTVPGHLLSPRGGDHYVLRVVGDSMDEEAITDGDYVIVLRRERAESGEMVVARIGDEETIKRYYPEDGGRVIRLEAANRTMPPIFVLATDVTVRGIVVGLMRKY